MQNCLCKRVEPCINSDSAFEHLVRIAEIADLEFGFEGIIKDIFHLVTPLITPLEMAQGVYSNKISKYRANVAKGMERFEKPAEICWDMQALILQVEVLSEFRQTV
jgi:hypothetical protein